jgi:hypothetical protein
MRQGDAKRRYVKRGAFELNNLKGLSRAVVAERRLGRLGNVEAFAGRGAVAPPERVRRRRSSTSRAGCATRGAGQPYGTTERVHQRRKQSAHGEGGGTILRAAGGVAVGAA